MATLCRETAAAPSAAARRPPARGRAPPRRRQDRASSAAGPSFRATEEGRLLGHVHLGLRLIEERAAGLDRDALAELLHAVACHHDATRGAHRRGGGALPREPARRASRRLGPSALAAGRSRWPSARASRGALGDFLGGLTSRRMHVLTRAAWSHRSSAWPLALVVGCRVRRQRSRPVFGGAGHRLQVSSGCLGLADALPRDGDRRDGNRRPDLRGFRGDSVRGRDRVRRATRARFRSPASSWRSSASPSHRANRVSRAVAVAAGLGLALIGCARIRPLLRVRRPCRRRERPVRGCHGSRHLAAVALAAALVVGASLRPWSSFAPGAGGGGPLRRRREHAVRRSRRRGGISASSPSLQRSTRW